MQRRTWITGVTALATGLVLGGTRAGMAQERHPHIRAALRDLRQAANQLEKAPHVFGGHRSKALELIKRAEQELRLALEYAKEHPEKGKPATTQPPPTPKTQ